MRRSWLTGAAALLVLPGVAGCAGGVAPSSAPPPPDAAARSCLAVAGGAPWHGMLRVDGDRATVDAHDDYFSPSCLVVPAGRPVTLVLTDRGHLPHTLVASGAALDASVDAGGTTFVPLPPLQRPTRLVCDLHEDEQMVLAVVPVGAGEG